MIFPPFYQLEPNKEGPGAFIRCPSKWDHAYEVKTFLF